MGGSGCLIVTILIRRCARIASRASGNLDGNEQRESRKTGRIKIQGRVMSQIFGGRWKHVQDLGEGGQAHTYLVVDTNGVGEERYVLKRLKTRV